MNEFVSWFIGFCLGMLLGMFFFFVGSIVNVSYERFVTAEELCSSNGGVSHIMAAYDQDIICKNGVIISTGDSE